MANVMSLKNLKNKVKRNGFDLSSRVAFTAKAGELLPVRCIETLPGDKVEINLSWFSRTRSLDTAAYTRMREYYDVFFVPFKLLWRGFDNFIDQVQNETEARDILTPVSYTSRAPYALFSDILSYLQEISSDFKIDNSGDDIIKKCKNYFGFNRGACSAKLLEYLGYSSSLKLLTTSPTAVDEDKSTLKYTAFNLWRLLAYQKIYQDYFRDSQWEKSAPYTWNLDYMSGNSNLIEVDRLKNVYIADSNTASPRYNMFDLRYCNWNKDLFTGLLPNPQFGEESIATPLVGSGNVGIGNQNQDLIKLYFSDDEDATGAKESIFNNIGLGVLALRKAEVMQKWKEISQSGRKDHQSQLEKHWNVRVSDYYSNRCTYVGGVAGNIDVSEVVNQSFTSDFPDAAIAGKGIGGDKGHISFEAKDYGVLMCIYHCVPLLDYDLTGIDIMNLKTLASDYAIPEFDSIGMQPIPSTCLSFSPYTFTDSPRNDGVLGYAPRYAEYKTAVDVVLGDFRETSRSWVAPMTSAYISSYLSHRMDNVRGDSLDYIFFKVNPQILDPIFGVNVDSSLSTDQFLCNLSFDCKAVRNLDYDGLPY